MDIFFAMPVVFDKVYTCYSMGFYKNCTETMENGGKILLPSSALELLTRLHIQYPMLFKLTNKTNSRHTHCGVLEFSADEGTLFAPYWMMMNLNITEGSQIKVENVALSIATYAKFQPLTADFHNIINPKAVLENELRNFACLTKGDVLEIKIHHKTYELKILETKPDDAVSIIECDMQIEFDEPLIPKYEDDNQNAIGDSQNFKVGDHIILILERDVKALQLLTISSDEEDDYQNAIGDSQNFKIFGGRGRRLDGKMKDLVYGGQVVENSVRITRERGQPNYDYKPGLLTFCRSNQANNQGDVQSNEIVLFPGKGKSLKESKY